MGFWYMGALKAAEKMSIAMKDKSFAKKYIFSLYIPFARLQPDCSLCLLQKVGEMP